MFGRALNHLQHEGRLACFQGGGRENAGELVSISRGDDGNKPLQESASPDPWPGREAYNEAGEQENKAIVGMVIGGVGLSQRRPG